MIYACTRMSIALGYDYTKRVQVLPKEEYELFKRSSKVITLKNKKRTIIVDAETFNNNFVRIK